MALDIDTEANNENLEGLDVEALDIDTEASNETEDFAVQSGRSVDYSSIEADIGDTGNRSDTFQTTWTP